MRYLKEYPLLYFKETAGRKMPWYCADDFKNYKSLNKKDWDYFDSANKLMYNFNSLGYRTSEFDNLPQDYVLVTGCSYTEGVGLYEEEIWCNQLGKELGFTVVNLAKAGTGPDIVNFNMQLFVKNKFVKPKAVIVQWPQRTRKTFGYLHKEGLHLNDRNVQWTDQLNDDTAERYEMLDSQWYFKRWAMEEGQQEYENMIHINSVNNIWNALDVPILHWTFQGDFQTRYNKHLVKVVPTEMTGRARDNAHDGADIHRQISEAIKDNVKCMI